LDVDVGFAGAFKDAGDKVFLRVDVCPADGAFAFPFAGKAEFTALDMQEPVFFSGWRKYF
jgi:hypothetical protein